MVELVYYLIQNHGLDHLEPSESVPRENMQFWRKV